MMGYTYEPWATVFTNKPRIDLFASEFEYCTSLWRCVAATLAFLHVHIESIVCEYYNVVISPDSSTVHIWNKLRIKIVVDDFVQPINYKSCFYIRIWCLVSRLYNDSARAGSVKISKCTKSFNGETICAKKSVFSVASFR